MGTSQQLQQQPQQLIQPGGGFVGSVAYDSSQSQPGAFHRQNSGGSEHGFVVPTAQFVRAIFLFIKNPWYLF